MKLQVIIEQDEAEYYVAEVPALPGCVSQGRTAAEAKSNIKEAIAGWLAVMNIDSALDKVMKLRRVSFDWKADGKHDLGMIAEDVGKVIPEVVAYEENETDAKS